MKKFIFCLLIFILLNVNVSASKLPKKIQKQIKKDAKQFINQIQLYLFTQEIKCRPCLNNDKLMNELANASDKKIKLITAFFERDNELVKQFVIDKIPAVALMVTRDVGIRFYGEIEGYKFGVLFTTIKMLATGQVSLAKDTQQKLRSIKKPVYIRILGTPTCKYCPAVSFLALQFAYFSSDIKTDIINIHNFPYIATKYNIRGVPYILINDDIVIPGVVSEKQLLNYVLKAARS